MDKFLSSKELWNKDGRTIVLYGDVWFSDEAMDIIMDFSCKGMWCFCRQGPSRFTGCTWGECFAQSFYPEDIDEHKRALLSCVGNNATGGWDWYKKIAGLPRNATAMGGHAVLIDDFTEDFDFPADLDNWKANREKWLGKE